MTAQLQLVYTILENDRFFANIIACTRQLLDSNAIAPVSLRVDDGWLPSTWESFAMPIVLFFLQVLTRTSHTPSDDTCAFVMQDLPRLSRLGAGAVFNEKLEHLQMTVRRVRPTLPQAIAGAATPLSAPHRSLHPAAAAAAQQELAADPPGRLARTRQPRHNNDHASICNIQPVPTVEELLCTHAPYMPRNSPQALHHLGDHSWARLLDTQFRLLREDMVASLREGISSFLQGFHTYAGASGSRYRTPGGSADLYVYTNAGKLVSLLQIHRQISLTCFLKLSARYRRRSNRRWSRSKLTSSRFTCASHHASFGSAASDSCTVRCAACSPGDATSPTR